MKENRLEKIVVNTSFGKQSVANPEFEKKFLPEIKKELAQILGQVPQPRAAKKSIAGFKIREGMVIGLRATLRGKRMKDFLDRAINIALPRIRDFGGIKMTSVDKSGNLTFGVKDQTVFPEIVLEESRITFGMEITIVLKNAMGREEAIEFYRKLGLPLQRAKVNK